MPSVEKMLQVAADTNSKIELRHTSAQGDVTEVKMTPSVARKIRSKEAKSKEKPRIAAKAAHDLLPHFSHLSDEKNFKRIQLGLPNLSGGLGEPELSALAAAIVKGMKTLGAEYYLDRMINELRSQGHLDLADALREQQVLTAATTAQTPLHTEQRRS
jgi:hypothetical protein